MCHRSFVNTDVDNPNSVSLAMANVSSASSTRRTVEMGPKISSRVIVRSVEPVSSVGAKNAPSVGADVFWATISAPSAVAAARPAATSSAVAVETRGPMDR